MKNPRLKLRCGFFYLKNRLILFIILMPSIAPSIIAIPVLNDFSSELPVDAASE
jgi:hypothetical protein